MRFSAFTASTPGWTPAEVTAILAYQGWDGVEWITDQDDAPDPGFWAGNRATWPLTGLEESLPAIATLSLAGAITQGEATRNRTSSGTGPPATGLPARLGPSVCEKDRSRTARRPTPTRSAASDRCARTARCRQ
jgi:hypothetical protein